MITNKELRMLQAQHPTENDPMPFARAVIVAYEAKLLEQEPCAFYDGNKFYANEESAICGCADMAKLKPVFTHPAPIPEGWISVEDAIPDAEVSVLVARLGRVNAQITCHTGKEWLLESNHFPVTHWRVIPRTPEQQALLELLHEAYLKSLAAASIKGVFMIDTNKDAVVRL